MTSDQKNEFLLQVLPGLKNLGESDFSMCAEIATPQLFQISTLILKEDQAGKFVYYVYHGQCRRLAKANPKDSSKTSTPESSPKENESETNVQIGKHNWIGTELLFHSSVKGKYDASVIALSEVSCFKFSIPLLQLKLSPEGYDGFLQMIRASPASFIRRKKKTLSYGGYRDGSRERQPIREVTENDSIDFLGDKEAVTGYLNSLARESFSTSAAPRRVARPRYRTGVAIKPQIYDRPIQIEDLRASVTTATSTASSTTTTSNSPLKKSAHCKLRDIHNMRRRKNTSGGTGSDQVYFPNITGEYRSASQLSTPTHSNSPSSLRHHPFTVPTKVKASSKKSESFFAADFTYLTNDTSNVDEDDSPYGRHNSIKKFNKSELLDLSFSPSRRRDPMIRHRLRINPNLDCLHDSRQDLRSFSEVTSPHKSPKRDRRRPKVMLRNLFKGGCESGDFGARLGMIESAATGSAGLVTPKLRPVLHKFATKRLDSFDRADIAVDDSPFLRRARQVQC